MNKQETNGGSKYQVFSGTARSQFCVLGYIEGFEDDYKLMKGIPVANYWPEDILIRMDPDFKTQIKLSDNLCNQHNVIIASKRLCDFLRKESVPNLEYLPIKVINHKKRPEKAEYWVVHLVSTQNCIDTRKSELEWNPVNKEDIATVRRLVFDESKIDRDAALFRAKHLKTAIFVRRDLAKKMQDGGFTGIALVEVAAFRC